MNQFPKEGGINFKIVQENDAYWATNSREYRWGPFGDSKVLDILVVKHPNRSLEIRVAFEHFYRTFIRPIPAPSADGHISVGLSWKGGIIDLSINGKLVHTASLLPMMH